MRPAMSWRLLLRGAGLCVLAGIANAQGKRALTAEEAIQTARFIGNEQSIDALNPQGAVSISPDGSRYVARIARGDVARDGVTMEIITGRLDSLDAAAEYEHVASFFSTGKGPGTGTAGPHQDATESSPVHWLDPERIAFLWSDDREIRQVVRVNVRTREVEWLTAHSEHIRAFDVRADGLVAYNARVRVAPDNTAHLLESGFVVGEHVDAYSLFSGRLESAFHDRAWNTEWFIQHRGASGPRLLKLGGRDVDPDSRHRIHLSPNGRWALANAAPAAIPDDWSRYSDRNSRTWIAEARRNPRAMMARNVHQWYLVDVEEGRARPLWDAYALIWRSSVAWSPDSRFVLLAPAFLPPQGADERGLKGHAAAIVEVATGRHVVLPVDLENLRVEAVRWLSQDRVRISARENGALRALQFRRSGRSWFEVPAGAPSTQRAHPRVRLELRQDIHTPPQLFAVDTASGRERLVLDPNPGLADRFALGKPERLAGELSEDVSWTALLIHPVGYEPGRRYPLVIQSQYGGRVAEEFSLFGYESLWGLGPPPIAVYPGQVLANRGIAVVHLNVHMGSKFGTASEAETRMRAFEAVAQHLSDRGLVDPLKVGLVGFSRNGFYVEYTLSHTQFPFAAAIAADNWDPSYVGQTLMGYGSAGADVNGAEPFGDGLRGWLEKAPGFNAEKIRAPLRMVEQNLGLFGVLLRWELYQRLRYLDRPVEFYVMPDAERGAHSPQNPRQILALMNSSADWFDFWLNGREREGAEYAAQYARWRKLRELRDTHRNGGAADSRIP
jgi:hypothetical protein